jgi:hypothetical protein
VHASLFSIHLWVPRVLIVQREKGHHNGTQTRPFVSLSERLPRPSEKGQQLSPSSRLPRCFAVPTGWGKKRPSLLGAGDEPTPIWGTVWWRSTLDNQHPWYYIFYLHATFYFSSPTYEQVQLVELLYR